MRSPIGWRRAGACDFAIDPRLSALGADVVWLADVDPRVVRLFQDRNPASSITVDRPDPIDIRAAADGWYARFGNCTDPAIAVLDQPTPLPATVAALIPFDDHTLLRLESAARLWRFLTGRAVKPSQNHLTTQRRQRLTTMLRALDGRACGADRRSLAVHLFGNDAVPPGVAFDDHHLRSRVSRLLRDGAALVAGGYRRLLGQSPKPDGS